MKSPFYLCFGLFCLIIALPAQAALPRSWIHDDLSISQQLNAQAALPGVEEASEAGKDFDSYFALGDGFLNRSRSMKGATSSRGWYLQSMRAEIGVQASGQVGLVGLGGEAAVELVWMRTKSAIEKLKQSVGVVSTPNREVALERAEAEIAQLQPQMATVEVESALEPVVQALVRSGKITGVDRFRARLLEEVQKREGLIAELANVPQDWAWKPYKFQLQLYVEGEGEVFVGLEAGVVARVRIEWDLRKSVRPVVRSGEAENSSRLLQFLTEDLTLLEGMNTSESRFTLDDLKFGLGVGVDGSIGFASGEVETVGSVFLKRDRTQAAVIAPSSVVHIANETYPGGLARERIRAGLLKARGIAEAVRERAEQHENSIWNPFSWFREFELGAIEIEFEITAQGGFVLPSVTKIGVMQLFLVRHNR